MSDRKRPADDEKGGKRKEEKKENEITLKIEAATSGSKQKEKEIVSLSQELNFSGLSTEEFTNAKMINKILDTSIEPKAIEIKDKFMVL